MIKTETPKALEAFRFYCALGSGRSLTKLHRRVAANVPEGWDRAPSLRTLKEWSRSHSWGDRVCEYEREVGTSVQAVSIQRDVTERVDALNGLNLLVAECQRILEDGLGHIRAESPQDLRAVASALETAAKTRELLEGRATGRFEHKTMEEMEAEMEEIERQLAVIDGVPLH